MKSQEDRALAESLFVRDGKSLEQIAASCGVAKGTLARWSKDGSWADKRRERQRESPQAAVEVLKRQRELQIGAIGGEKLADAGAIDALHKLNLAIAGMESQSNAIGPMLDCMSRFAQFVASHANGREVAEIREWIEKFLTEERRKNA